MGVITAAEADGNLSALLERVRQGERISITAEGRVVAELVPPSGADGAGHAFLEELDRRPRQLVEPWTRDEIYRRDAKA